MAISRSQTLPLKKRDGQKTPSGGSQSPNPTILGKMIEEVHTTFVFWDS